MFIDDFLESFINDSNNTKICHTLGNNETLERLLYKRKRRKICHSCRFCSYKICVKHRPTPDHPLNCKFYTPIMTRTYCDIKSHDITSSGITI